jgi:hypothetical protein
VPVMCSSLGSAWEPRAEDNYVYVYVYVYERIVLVVCLERST